MSCSSCGENRFSNSGQLGCHISKNHAEFACPCSRKFMTEDDLQKHQVEMKVNAKACSCSTCCRSFTVEERLHAHKRSKSHWKKGEREKAQETTGRTYCDDQHCGRSFKSADAFRDHVKGMNDKYRNHNTCLKCNSTFATPGGLSHHKRDTNHEIATPKNARKVYIDTFCKDHVAVKTDDKKTAVADFKGTVDKIMAHVRGPYDGKVYSADVRKAGSHAIKAKIGKADEFDTNIPLNVDVKEVRTRGELHYVYADKIGKPLKGGPSPKNMNVDRVLIDKAGKTSRKIAIGHAIVKVDERTPSHLTHNGDLVPHKVQKDLHSKVSKAITELGLKDVHLNRHAHGPALTITIKREGNHDISIDLTPSMPCKVPVTDNGWPRPDTKKAYSKEIIDAVKDVGIHLVPKGDETWTMSYSNAEKQLLRNIDAGNGCRKSVLKVMKRHAQVCSSQPDGLPGFSSHILKHQVLWSSEQHSEPGYWHAKNIDTCLMDTMKDTEHALRTSKLPNYFSTSENILANKGRGALNRMADHLKQERQKLAHMNGLLH